jgi:hypothetical protein
MLLLLNLTDSGEIRQDKNSPSAVGYKCLFSASYSSIVLVTGDW